MSIICKTGCGQQVVYENIEFTDGFAYQCPHNLDNSLHYCPIFYSDSSLFTQPGGAHPFDSIPDRENSYGNEIEKMGQIFYEFDDLIISKNKNLSIEDIEIYKTRLQSFLNILPINGLYTDATSGYYDIDEESFENAKKSGALSSIHNKDEGNHGIYFTLSSSPLTALKKIYYILEGDSINFKKCQQLDKEIMDNNPNNVTAYEENPFELQLIEAQKQLEFFQNKLKNDVMDNNKGGKIKDIIQYYHELIDGISMDEFDTRKHIFNGVSSAGIKDNIKRWYKQKKDHLHHSIVSEKLKISLDEAEYLTNNHWDYMSSESKEMFLGDLDINMEKSKIVNLKYKEFEASYPEIVSDLLELGVFGSDSSRQLAEKFIENIGNDLVPDVGESRTLFDIKKIRELIIPNLQNVEDKIIKESVKEFEKSLENSSKESMDELKMTLEDVLEVGVEFEKIEPPKYDFNSHFNQNSIVHLSNTEKHIRKLIINKIYDYDINFLKKHFKQIWMDMENKKLRDGKNIRIPKEETEFDYATFGQLLEILKNKETRNRVKIKKIVALENLIQKIEIILPYRNELDHVRGTTNGDLDINTKCIVVGICNEIDEFSTALLYQ